MAGPALKWWKLSTRMVFAGEAAGGGSEAPSGAPPAGGGGDGGGAPPASPAPSSEPAAPAPDGAEGAIDWSALGSPNDLDEHIEIPAGPEPGPKPQEPTPKPEEPPPAAPPQPEPPPAAQQAQPQTGAAQPLSASDPWRIAEGLESNRDAIVAHLAATKFALSEAEQQEIDTDAIAAIPKLLSRVFLESQVSMQKFLAQAVPGMVRQFNTVSSANSRAEEAFFATHKALDVNNPLHRSTAVRIATVYRQANPDIPLNQLIAEVGPMVMAALRVNAPAAQPGTPAGGTPAQLPRGGTPFRPAVNGGGGVSANPDPGNPWEGLGRNYDDGA